MGVFFFLSALNLVMVLSTIQLPNSWGMTEPYHQVNVVSHVQKHLLVVYSRNGRWDFEVNGSHSRTVTVDTGSTYSLCWGIATDASSMDQVMLVDNGVHRPSHESSVDVYDSRVNQDGQIFEFKPPMFKKDSNIDEFCEPLGLISEKIKHALLHGKKP